MKSNLIKTGLSLLLYFNIFVFISVGSAQNQKTWEWAKNIVGSSKNIPYALATDKEGNSYVAGGFTDTVKVGNRVLISRGSYDMYLLKYDKAGQLVWAQQAGGTDSDEAYAVAIDRWGNIFMTGYISGSANFGSMLVKSSGDRDFFVAKYNSSGTVLWVKKCDSSLEDFGTAIATDKSGNVLITGIFHGNMQLGNSRSIAKGAKDIFLIRYSTNGDLLWARTGGGTMDDVSTAITTDAASNIYVAGYFSGTVAFDKKESMSTGLEDIFLAKYDSTGKIEWLRREGSATGDDRATAVAVDGQGDIYVTGYFSGSAYFGKFELKNVGSDDIFVVKYNQSGEALWAVQTGGKGNEHARGLALDGAGNIYITGDFTADFTIGDHSIKSIGEWDIFIIKYNKMGTWMGGTELGGTGFDKAIGIALDANANVFVTGCFSKAITLGGFNLNSIDENDGFIAKLKNF